jgi:hypothetical protein
MRRYELRITDQEKIDLQTLAEELGISLNELVTQALYEALQTDATGVYFAGDE